MHSDDWQLAAKLIRVMTSVLKKLHVKFPICKKIQLYTCLLHIHTFYGNMPVYWELFRYSRRNSWHSRELLHKRQTNLREEEVVFPLPLFRFTFCVGRCWKQRALGQLRVAGESSRMVALSEQMYLCAFT